MKENTDKTAILMTGTYREVDFLLDIMPEITQGLDYDLYIVLRHVAGEISRLGQKESDFKLPAIGESNIFLCELPSMDKAEVMSRYLIPVGPTDIDRECAIISMFHGVFTAISMMKSSLRKYDYVLKTRTDYLPPLSLPEMIATYEQSQKIIVDGCASWSRRYPDRFDILWQGSLSDLLCFAPTGLFLKVWDFENILAKVWTGIPETTLFRATLVNFIGDDMQSPRRNDTFLKKYFTWDLNDTKQSFHVLRRSAELLKSNEAIYFKGNEIIKYYADESKVKGKVERAKLLKGFVPEITRVSKNFFTYKYVDGIMLADGSVDQFKDFLRFMQNNIWKPLKYVTDFNILVEDFNRACEKFYNYKTYSRLKEFETKTGIADKKETINDVEILSCNDMLEDIDWEWLCNGIPCLFHGDPQPENVIITKDGFCLLDWRENFAGLQYGDVYYDLAKVYHRLIVAGDVIREGGYSVKENPIEIVVSAKDKLIKFQEAFRDFVLDNGYSMKKIDFLTALVYLNSSALHTEPYNRFLYYFGKKYLHDLLEAK